MKTIHPYKIASLVVIFTLGFYLPAFADDVEIYVGNTNGNGGGSQNDIRPNLVFIIDTSGSMNGNVDVTSNDTFVPATVYDGDCVADRIYWSSKGKPPACNTDKYFAATSNHCEASASALSATGAGSFLTTKAARYRVSASPDQWDDLDKKNHDDAVECQNDLGVHGQNGTANNKYPADGDNGGPWRNNSTNAINWGNTGKSYTFYNGNYLNWRNSPAGTPTTKTRLEIVQEVFSDLMDRVSNINIAVMRFDDKSGTDNQGGYFAMPMAQLTDANKQLYKDAVNGFSPGGNTPLAETLYESYLFYKGAAVKFGDDTSPATNVAGVFSGSNYVSPIEYQCQKNFVILLTDGEPTNDTGADSNIEGLTGFSTVNGGSASCTDNCLDELADYMYTKDCSTLADTQNVITYTIGFHTDQALLSNAATKGGGAYYKATDTAGLTDVFTSILTEILAVNTSFIAPAVSVNAFNRFTHRDELYYALFRPNSRPRWDGNVKRYRLFGNPPEIVDVGNTAAIDPNTGFFTTTAQSFWTPAADAPDGDVVKIGGAASMLGLPRAIYTYTAAADPSNASLTSATNAISDTNVAITKTMLGDAAMTDADRTSLLNWAKGVDVMDSDADTAVDDARRFLGDPLHAKPLLVTYGGDDANPDITLYAGTNEGHLFAINTTTGAEVFTFVPQELLPNLLPLYTNSSNTAHAYGLDGPLTAWFNDVNHNGVLLDGLNAIEAGEHVYLYQAMRRGGSNYYALDVSNRSAPVLKWIIRGGAGAFSELGQTWSAANKAKIKLNGTDRNVLIFGGGYDTDQDTNTTAVDDDLGRAIFMVDAETGVKIWQAGASGSSNGSDPDLLLTDMTNSIPADVSVIDMDLDGYADRMYVGDMRGQLWRFDIDKNSTSTADLVSGGVIARLGGSTAAENRRFYYKPDVSLSEDGRHINLAIGSGYRSHPLATDNEDMFFVIRDKNVYAPAVDASDNPVYTAITLADLFDTTSNVIGQGTDAEVAVARTALDNAEGFYIRMNETDGSYVGEKVLAKSTTFDGKVIFTTYTPVASASSACSPSQGSARAYYISVTDGSPVIDADSSGGDLVREDRRNELVRGGIPPEPSIIFHESGPTVLIGTEKGPDPDLSLKPRKTHWLEQ